MAGPDAESDEAQEARLHALWRKLDTKRKGTLDLPALKHGLQQMNHPLKDAETLIRDMLTACDINQDGKISYDEFTRFCKETERQLWGLFTSIDRDRDGRLDKGELSAAFERAGVNVGRERLDRFFEYIDRDNNGSIDFDEWRGTLHTLGRHAGKHVFVCIPVRCAAVLWDRDEGNLADSVPHLQQTSSFSYQPMRPA